MRLKGHFIYESIDDLKKNIQEGKVEVEDELITKDIDGEAIYVVADVSEEQLVLVRKFVLSDSKPMRGRYNLIEWLNDEYKDSLDEELIKMMIAPQGQQLIDLPREIDVFGENKWGIPEEGSRWEYFEKLNNRICGTGDDAEYSEWWWLNTQHRASAAYFCSCGNLGDAGCNNARYASPYVRPRFILAK